MDEQVRDVEPLGKRIRNFFRELFGSRMMDHLEVELLRLRQDFESRLQDKDKMISALREEKALLMSKIAVYELTIMPHASRAGAEVVKYQKPTKPAIFDWTEIPAPKSRWQTVQEEHEKQLAKEEEEEKQKAAKAAKE